MIAVQMGDEDGVDLVRLQAEPAHTDQRGGAAIDEKIRGPRAHLERGL